MKNINRNSFDSFNRVKCACLRCRCQETNTYFCLCDVTFLNLDVGNPSPLEKREFNEEM